MGRYLNPGNNQFKRICASDYVDKTGLILEINRLIGTDDNLFLVSRPRRFGKSYAAAMLCAYYGYGSNSAELFREREAGRRDPDLTHLGEYDVLYLDMTDIRSDILAWQKYRKEEAQAKGEQARQIDWIYYMQQLLIGECVEAFGESVASFSLVRTLDNVVQTTGRQFFWICDEWDLFLREACDDRCAAENYLDLLRSLFKTSSGYTARIFAGAYLTGIMPMKVMKGQSAVSSFLNYTMLSPGPLAPYIGFTSDEVQALCNRYEISYPEMADWYDGYTFKDVGSVFNPRSVMEAIRMRQFRSYWVQTGSYENLKTCIEMNLDGLWDTVLGLLGGTEAEIDGDQFGNDLTCLSNANAVLTALTHLGYFSCSPETGRIHIPNKEIRKEFLSTLRNSSHAETARMVRDADSLLAATWEGDGEEVGRLVGLAHSLGGDPKTYNSEARLAQTIRLAYCTARDHYIEISELPGGKGYADIVFLPKRNSDKPLLVVELKWDKPVTAAIAQIRGKNYPDLLKGYGGKILLVGITYKVRGKRHICRIEPLTE